MTLTPAQERFIVHWGEMGSKWGVNRTVAQIHALLYLATKPLHAEEITETLSIARSNVSASLRELQGWGLVRTTHLLGDRRDHFETQHDVWELFRIIVEERKRREVDPTLEVLRACVTEAEKGGPNEAETLKRLKNMQEFFESMSGWYAPISKLSTPNLQRFVRLGSKVPKLLGLG